MTVGQWLPLLALVAGVVGALGGLGYLGILLFRKHRAAAEKALQALLAECAAFPQTSGEDLVQITFWLYVGFLNTLAASRFELAVPKSQALALLKRLRNFNFKWGLAGAGGLFVPFSTWYHYARQRRRVLAALAGDS